MGLAAWLIVQGSGVVWAEMLDDVADDLVNKDQIIYEAWMRLDDEEALTGTSPSPAPSGQGPHAPFDDGVVETVDWMAPVLFSRAEAEGMFGDFIEGQIEWYCDGASRMEIVRQTLLEASVFWVDTVSITYKNLWTREPRWTEHNLDLRLFLVEKQSYWIEGQVSRAEITFRTIWGATRLFLGICIITYENVKIMRPPLL